MHDRRCFDEILYIFLWIEPPHPADKNCIFRHTKRRTRSGALGSVELRQIAIEGISIASSPRPGMTEAAASRIDRQTPT